MKLQLLDAVVAKEAMPEQSVYQGALCTIVEVLDDSKEVYLVEFAGTDGVEYALLALKSHQLLKVYEEPMATA